MINVSYVLVSNHMVCIQFYISSGLNLTQRKLNTSCSELLYNKALLSKKKFLYFRRLLQLSPFISFNRPLSSLPLSKITNILVFILYFHRKFTDVLFISYQFQTGCLGCTLALRVVSLKSKHPLGDWLQGEAEQDHACCT